MSVAVSQFLSRHRRDGFTAFVLAGLTVITFLPALRCDFINFDDPDYVTNNPHVTAGLTESGTRWAFTTFTNSNWHPLTWLSLQLDASLWWPDPWGFHLTNVFLHSVNAALVFLALQALTGAFWRSAVAALLFAVHPLRVESVAWISERKDVLSITFGLLALLAYAGYARRPSRALYLAVMAAFVLSLLSKPMLVTLPFLLLVLDWWPLGRAQAREGRGRLVIEKLPLFALVLASSVVTYRAQLEQSAVGNLERFPLSVRVENATVSYVTYLWKTAWPADLGVYYPHPIFDNRPGKGLSAETAGGAGLLLIALTAGAIALRRRAPYLLGGWLWYLGTLVPVIGLVQVGSQAYADRYTYFPQIGLLIALCWGVAELASKRERVALALGSAAALALAVASWDQLAVWKDSVALWKQTLNVTFSTATGEMNLGVALEEKNDIEGAARCYRRALAYEPKSVRAHINMGNILCRQGMADGSSGAGKLSEAALELTRAIDLGPHLAESHCDLARIEAARGNLPLAVTHYERALKLKPDYSGAHLGLAVVLLTMGKTAEGKRHLEEASRYDPKSPKVHDVLGSLLESQGDIEGAIPHHEQAVRLGPKVAVYWYWLGRVRQRQERLPEAIECFKKAVELQPESREFHQALDGASGRRRGPG